MSFIEPRIIVLRLSSAKGQKTCGYNWQNALKILRLPRLATMSSGPDFAVTLNAKDAASSLESEPLQLLLLCFANMAYAAFCLTWCSFFRLDLSATGCSIRRILQGFSTKWLLKSCRDRLRTPLGPTRRGYGYRNCRRNIRSGQFQKSTDHVSSSQSRSRLPLCWQHSGVGWQSRCLVGPVTHRSGIFRVKLQLGLGVTAPGPGPEVNGRSRRMLCWCLSQALRHRRGQQL